MRLADGADDNAWLATLHLYELDIELLSEYFHYWYRRLSPNLFQPWAITLDQPRVVPHD